MKALEQLERLKTMNKLIKEETTGKPENFAAQIGISPSHLYRCIDEIKELGAPIHYSRMRETYFYEFEFDLRVSYSIELISKETAKKIAGGFFWLKNTSLLFFESGQRYFSTRVFNP